MEQQERETFEEALIGVLETYQRRPSAVSLDIYWQAMRPYPMEAVLAALVSHCRTQKVPPTIAHLVEMIQGPKASKAIEAWNQVIVAVREAGRTYSIRLGDPIAMRILWDFGGWPEFCAMLTDPKETRFAGIDFQKRYLAYLDSPPQGWPTLLTGIGERENRGAGWERQDPERWRGLYDNFRKEFGSKEDLDRMLRGGSDPASLPKRGTATLMTSLSTGLLEAIG